MNRNAAKSNSEYRIQAEFIVVEPQVILSDAQIVIRNGQIVELCTAPSVQPDLHLANSTLLPGFINSHTHLEFSDLGAPLPAGADFPSWIGAVLGHRRNQQGTFGIDQLREYRQRVVAEGLAECYDWGTAVVVDIVTVPWSGGDLEVSTKQPGAKIIAMPEILGLEQPRFQQSWDWADALLKSATPLTQAQSVIDMGISPHAPYSLIHPGAIEHLGGCYPDAKMAMHVAESLAERQWLEHGSGPFQELYRRIGLPIDAPRMQIVDAIELLASRSCGLLVHGNYLLAEELDRIAQTSITIVYCPRTHQHFGHQDYPLQMMRERSIPVVLGTDSRASNPDLSVWQECCLARQLHPTVWSSADALAAVTILPARILGLEGDWGSLQPGRQAFLNCATTPDGATLESLLDRLVDSAAMPPRPLRGIPGLAPKAYCNSQ